MSANDLNREIGLKPMFWFYFATFALMVRWKKTDGNKWVKIWFGTYFWEKEFKWNIVDPIAHGIDILRLWFFWDISN